MDSPKDKSLLPLKIMVFSLGALLLGGIVFLFAAVIERHNERKTAPESSAESSDGRPTTSLPLAGMGAPCKDDHATLALPQGARVEDFRNEGPNLLLMVVMPGGFRELWTVDGCTGAMLHRITLSNAAG